MAPEAAEDTAPGLDVLLHADSSPPPTVASPATPTRLLSTDRRLNGVSEREGRDDRPGSRSGLPPPTSDMVPPSARWTGGLLSTGTNRISRRWTHLRGSVNA